MTNYLNTYRRYAYDIDRINYEAKNDPKRLIELNENLLKRDLGFIADRLFEAKEDRHIVLLSGPSGSGKTTCVKKLGDELKKHDIDVIQVSMDDFYLGMDRVRRLPDGRPDFESVDALDIPLIKKTMNDLLTYGECVLPKYDFTRSVRSDRTKKVQLAKNSAVIIEGIHALNPVFSAGMPVGNVVKLYVSVKQGIKDDEDYVLTNKEIRFIRRLVRDHSYRRVEPAYMLSMWESVINGEKKYIRPYRYTSDFTINSIHIFEPCIMKRFALALLSEITDDNPHIEFVEHLKASLERFEDIDSDLIPQDSLIREFIGGGSYEY